VVVAVVVELVVVVVQEVCYQAQQVCLRGLFIQLPLELAAQAAILVLRKARQGQTRQYYL
jgi:hypothetical protein